MNQTPWGSGPNGGGSNGADPSEASNDERRGEAAPPPAPAGGGFGPAPDMSPAPQPPAPRPPAPQPPAPDGGSPLAFAPRPPAPETPAAPAAGGGDAQQPPHGYGFPQQPPAPQPPAHGYGFPQQAQPQPQAQAAFGAPQPQQPQPHLPFTGGQVPPPPPSPVAAPVPEDRRRPKWVIPVAAVVVLALAGGGVYLWAPWDSSGGDGPAKKGPDKIAVAAKAMKTAAARLEKTRATAYDGDYADAQDGSGTLQLTSTPSGRSSGTMTPKDGDKLGLFSVGPTKVFVKGDEKFWSQQGLKHGTKLTAYSDHWVKAPFLLAGQTKLVAALAPDNVAAAMRKAADQRQLKPGAVSAVGGVKAQRIVTPGVTYYVSPGAGARLVRIETGGPAAADTPSPSGSGAPDGSDGKSTGGGAKPVSLDAAPADNAAGSVPGGVKLNVTEPNDTAAAGFKKDYGSALDGMSSSVDTDVSFSIPGKVKLNPCTSKACTSTSTVKNEDRRAAAGDTSAANTPVDAMVTVRMTLDGKLVKTCRIPKTMKPNTSTSVKCRATYHIPASHHPTTHKVLAEVAAVARGASDAQVKQYRDDFDAEWAAPGSTPSSPSPTPSTGDSSNT